MAKRSRVSAPNSAPRLPRLVRAGPPLGGVVGSTLLLAFLCGPQVFVGLVSPTRRLGHVPRWAAAELWQEASQAERGRSELLLSKLEERKAGQARRRATQDLEGVGSEQLRQKCLELQEAVRSLLEAEGASQSSFEQLRESNDQLEEALQELQNPGRSSLPSFVPDAALPGDPVRIDVLPPARETDGPALLPGEAHVWGKAAFFGAMLEAIGGWKKRSGDVLRAVSYVGAGPEPGWLDKMLGAEAMPMKQVMKCDGRPLEEVIEALQSNSKNPDGEAPSAARTAMRPFPAPMPKAVVLKPKAARATGGAEATTTARGARAGSRAEAKSTSELRPTPKASRSQPKPAPKSTSAPKTPGPRVVQTSKAKVMQSPATARAAARREPPWREAEPTQREARAAYDTGGRSQKAWQDQWDQTTKTKNQDQWTTYNWSKSKKRLLPIQERRDEVVSVLCGPSRVVCLLGETGSGKSTQVPQIILEEARRAQNDARVCVTQPRRVAALNLANRVATELGEAIGYTVGYRIGGESRRGENIDFCTVGYMLQVFLNTPEEFGHYTHIVLDEVHERSVAPAERGGSSSGSEGEAPELALPSSKAPFEKISCLGEGAFGAVWLARSKSSGQYVALKEIGRHHADVALLRPERDLLRRIADEGGGGGARPLTGLVATYTTPFAVCLAMELVEGTHLFDHLKAEKRFTEDRVQWYASEIAGALEWLHSKGWLYRDLKLTNVMLSDQALGTLQTMAPEVIACAKSDWLKDLKLEAVHDGKKAGYGPQADWWSLGVILFELLTGEVPFGRHDDLLLEGFRVLQRQQEGWMWPDLNISSAAKEAAGERAVSHAHGGAESDMLCLVVRLLAQQRFRSTRLVIMSATLQSGLFATYFATVSPLPVGNVFVGARCFKVTEYFLEDLPKAFRKKLRCESLIQSRIKEVFGLVKPKKIDQKHCDKMHSIILELLEVIASPAPPEDSTILVFLPGIAEISALWQEARDLEHRGFRIFPLHSMVPREEQETVDLPCDPVGRSERAWCGCISDPPRVGSGAIGLGLGMPTSPCEELVFQEPEPGITNVVLATDIAESSITLPHEQQEEEEMQEEINALVKEAETTHRRALSEGALAGHQPLFMLPILHHFRAVSSTFVDCTFGRGGHARALLKHASSQTTLHALDVDPKAVEVAHALAAKEPRLKVYRRSYAELSEILESQEPVHGVLINGGITTDSKNDIERGIRKGPLDLRYDNEVGLPCSEWLAKQSFKELSKDVATGKWMDYGYKGVLAALRRFINREFEELGEALVASLKHLKMGGRCLLVCQSRLDSEVIWRFIRQNEEPSNGAASRMDQRRLKKLYPLAGTQQNYAVRVVQSTSLTRREQKLCFKRPTPLVVVAVVDLGLHRRMDHDASKGIASLATKWISKAAATQRSGRAGRTQPGLCLRLYTQEFFNAQMHDFEPPESKSMALDRLYLQAKQLSVQLNQSLQGYGAPQGAQQLLSQLPEEGSAKAARNGSGAAPDLKNVTAARQKNAELGTISDGTEAAKITALGYLCLQLPLELKLTRLVWLGAHFGVVADAVVLASVMSSQDAFSMPSPLFMREDGRGSARVESTVLSPLAGS
eukprot:g31943.t1